LTVQPGRILSHYRLVEKIGEGGMGVVWKATDTTLDRPVAIKILPDLFAEDPERLARFEREAKLLASLNHPNIAAIYGLHEAEGVRFLAMELVEGEDLARRLARGAVPMEEALAVGRQVAEALEAAHEHSVIHRDLKPANIRITPEGKVKVLDFGLAKAVDVESVPESPSLSPTMTTAGTRAGVILGTAAYMSPEQARGKAVDRRGDIWAFGCVLFESLTGRQVFSGETVSDTLAAVLRAEPEWAALPPETPSKIRDLLRRCLHKDPRQRLRDIGEARIAVHEALAEPAGPSEAVAPVVTQPRWQRALPWGVAALMTLVTAFSLWSLRRIGAEAPRPSTHLSASAPASELLANSEQPTVALSANGRELAYVAHHGDTTQLFLRLMDRAEATALTGTEGASNPFFSPDGEWLGFFADAKLKKVSVRGGAPLVLCDAPQNRGAAWGPDDTIIFSPMFVSGLMRIPAAGGTPQAVTTPETAKGERTHRWPEILPDGKAVIFTIGTTDSPTYYEDAKIELLSLATGKRRVLVQGGSMARYAGSGHLVYARAGVLFAVPFDSSTLEAQGAPVPVLQGVGGDPSSGAVNFALATNGTLAYVPGLAQAPERTLVWVSRKGEIQPLPVPPRPYRNPRLSPDGRRLAVEVGQGAGRQSDIWVLDIGRGTFTRLTFNTGSFNPIWSPDGKRLTFNGPLKSGLQGLQWKPADGSAPEEMLTTSRFPEGPESWTPDGRQLTFFEIGTSESDIWNLSLEVERKPQPIIQTRFSEWGSSFSPDGRWLAYNSDESGRFEVYVQPFPGPGGKWQISNDGGWGAAWARNGRELFYVRGNDRMMVVSVQTRPTFAPGTPRALFESASINLLSGYGHNYDVSPDGQRFIAVRSTEAASAATQVNIVLNWFDDLLRAVPAGKK